MDKPMKIFNPKFNFGYQEIHLQNNEQLELTQAEGRP